MAVTGLIAGCATSGGTDWARSACASRPGGGICAVGSSGLVEASAEAARSAAEVDAMAGLRRQLASPAQGPGPTPSAPPFDGSLKGVRFTGYHYEPDRTHPTAIFVRAELDAEAIDRLRRVPSPPLSPGEAGASRP